jgi:hypothetical protein
LLVLVAVLVAGGLVDRRARTGSGEAASISAQVPVGAPVTARSSAWYCPGGLAGNPAADAAVVVANAGDRPLTGTITVFPDKGDSRQAPITVGPSSRAAVRLADVVTATYASAVVELDGGDAVAEMVASGTLGDSVTQCASSASASWYFAEGATTKDAAEILLVLNPFPDDAVIDVTFSTEEGLVSPQALTGLLVKGQALTPINVGDFVQRRESVSASVVARTGRLAVGRLQTFDGTGTTGRKGISVGLGAAAAGPLWYFPGGLIADGLGERFQIYNPAKQEAQVTLTLTLDAGEAEPLQVTVPRESRVTVVANDESRIPKGVGHSVTVRTTSGPDVVVERTVDGASPSSRTGLSITLGARLPATRWATAAGAADDNNDEWVAVQNPGTRSALVTVNLLGDGAPVIIGGLSSIEVPAGQRRELHLNTTLKRATTPLMVSSSVPVVVERDTYKVKAPGLGMSVAIPLREPA